VVAPELAPDYLSGGGGQVVQDAPAQQPVPKAPAKTKPSPSATPTEAEQSAAAAVSGPDRNLISTVFGIIAVLGSIGIALILRKMKQEKHAVSSQ
jgi:hypothetical protein